MKLLCLYVTMEILRHKDGKQNTSDKNRGRNPSAEGEKEANAWHERGWRPKRTEEKWRREEQRGERRRRTKQSRALSINHSGGIAADLWLSGVRKGRGKERSKADENTRQIQKKPRRMTNGGNVIESRTLNAKLWKKKAGMNAEQQRFLTEGAV